MTATALTLLILATPSLLVAEPGWGEAAGQDEAAAMVHDIDADGQPETIRVSLPDQYTLRVEVLAADGTSQVQDVEVDAHVAQATVEPMTVAGVPLLRVDATLEACGPYSTTWFSYAPDPVGAPTLRRALHLVGYADDVESIGFDVRFDSSRGRAQVNRVYESGDEQAIAAGEAFQYELREGVFQPLGSEEIGEGIQRWGDWDALAQVL